MAENEAAETVTALTWAQIQARIEEEAEDDDIDIAELPRTTDAIWASRFDAVEAQVKITIKASAPSWQKMKDSEREAYVESALSDMTPMRIGRGRPWPLQPAYIVMYLFKDADELRVYTVPASSFVTGTKEAPVPATPTPIGMRYSINRANPKPTFTAEAVMIDVWISEVVRECIELDGEVNVEENAYEEGEEAEQAQVLAYLATLPEGYRIVDLISDIKEGVHAKVEVPEPEDSEPDLGNEDEDEDPDGDDPVAASNGQPKPSAATAEPPKATNETATTAQ